eukprot:CAMPEP_0167832446 /NCGR_PEP_ID=MMETSP0112_2-20121227/14346_1 /TAXON_ID=91324 /ORGANISM="Lotharella globosa, Strain CCCM811" /LENGTH=46 /DNA_ID= /DNA_START= /DNA_END= /DNA_ORIENTATION=
MADDECWQVSLEERTYGGKHYAVGGWVGAEPFEEDCDGDDEEREYS